MQTRDILTALMSARIFSRDRIEIERCRIDEARTDRAP